MAHIGKKKECPLKEVATSRRKAKETFIKANVIEIKDSKEEIVAVVK